ncbi:NAD(P)H-dependent oxidoreductase [Aquitalea sp.]|uniref:flavodoxin family protein n=1 Tax=Aquitalea sp. TaxID=1872623 RepID=UPI00258BE064|nr:NAD(P)H-dependent oxidoreductase [Aquitalea sp.]
MKQLLIVHASQTGHTLQLVEAFCRPLLVLSTELQLCRMPAQEATLDDLLSADGIVLATPENFGYMAGKMKDFFDRTFYPAQGLTAGLPYLMLVSAGTDGQGAIQSMRRIATGYGWKEVLPPVLACGEVTAEHLAAAEQQGEYLAAGMLIGRW